MKKPKLFAVTGSAGIMLLAGMMVLTMLRSPRANHAVAADRADGAAESSQAAVRVEVATPAKRTMMRTLRLPASLQAYESAELYAKTSGYVARVRVDIGSQVAEGEELLSIDVPEMADELAQAEAALAAKEAAVVQARTQIDTARAEVTRSRAAYELRLVTHDRRKQLLEQHAIPQQEYDEVQSQLHVAEADVRIAEAMVAGREADLQVTEAAVALARANLARMKTLMGYATLRAPFDGVITERFVHPGAFVRSAAEGATSPLLSIARLDRLRLALEIPESDAAFVQIGADVEVKVRSCMDEALTATVTRVARALRPATRTMSVEVDLTNNDGKLAPGMYAQATVLLETQTQAMMVPSKAIRVRGEELSVMVAKEGKARAVPIALGYDDGIWAEVRDGLEGDEQVIVAASGALAPGAPVTATAAGAGEAGDAN